MEYWLPLFFMAAMGLALLIYVVLDGYDLGIGILLPFASDEEKDVMISSIGPFWDANETWIVLGVGILLIAFPAAHGIVLTELYLPVAVMLTGLILRGVAFDFRIKAVDNQKRTWNRLFTAGSGLAAISQGWMLGAYITGLDHSLLGMLFSLLIALSLPSLYVMLGAAWLLIKTEDTLQHKALGWARRAILPMGLALLLVSIATPLISETIADKWFSPDQALQLFPIPLFSLLVYSGLLIRLQGERFLDSRQQWHCFAGLIFICLMATLGLAYSIFPEIVIGRLDIWQASAATDSLLMIFWGTIVTLPAILIYTFFVYRVFRGKATSLSYQSDE